MANTRIKFNQLDLEGYSESGNTTLGNVIASIGDFNGINNNNFIKVDDGGNNITINGNDVIGFNKDIRISGSSTFFGRLNADNLTTTNRTLNLPNSEGTLVTTINGITADTFGNVNITISGGSGSSLTGGTYDATGGTLTLTDSSNNSIIVTGITQYDDTNIRLAINNVSNQSFNNTPSFNRTQRDAGNTSDVGLLTYDRDIIETNITSGPDIGKYLLFRTAAFNGLVGSGIFNNNDSIIKFNSSFEFTFPGSIEYYSTIKNFEFNNTEIPLTNLDTGYTAYLITLEGAGAFSDITDTSKILQTFDLIAAPSGATPTIIDDAFSISSTNPLENNIIRNELFVLEGVASQNPVTHAQRIGLAFNANFKIRDVNTDVITADNITFDREIIIANIGGVNYLFMDKNSFDGSSYLKDNILDATGNIIKFTLLTYISPDILLNYRNFSINTELIFEDTIVTGSVNGTVPVNYEAFVLLEGSNLVGDFDSPLAVNTRNTAIVLKNPSSGGSDTFISGGTYNTTGGTYNSTGGTLTLNNTTGGTLLIDSISVPTGLEAINEGNGIGWRLIGKNVSNYGNIGEDAIDLSTSLLTSTVNGATGQRSFATGVNTIASGIFSFASGANTEANATYSSAIGLGTTASNADAHAQGRDTIASGPHSHAEGRDTIASGATAHAEGFTSRAFGENSHAEGRFSIASGIDSHSEGKFSLASGEASHAGGSGSSDTIRIIAQGASSFNHSSVNEPGVSGVTGNESAILGGLNNTLTGTRSVVLGGTGITGTSNDTVYVPNLNINTVPATGTSNMVLARSNDGSIIEVSNISGSSANIIIDTVLSATSTNALENQVIEDTFQKTILATSQELVFKQPSTTFTYKRNPIITNSLTGVTTDANVIMISSNTINVGDWYMLIEDSFLSSNQLINEYFSSSGKLVHFSMGDTTTVFGTSINYVQRLLTIVMNTTPVTDFIDIPTGYTLYREENIFNSVVAGSSAASTKTFNLNLVRPKITGLEAIDEGNGIGWRLIGRNPNRYFNIGLDATDFSSSNSSFLPRGAEGTSSFVIGDNNYGGGDYSFAGGRFTIASGNTSTSLGSNTIANGVISMAIGANTRANGATSFAGGGSSLSTRNTIADGINSFNYSYVDVDNISGVTGDYSAILGGIDNTLTGTRSVVLGGTGITGTSNDTVYVPNLNINTVPATGTSNTALSRSNDGSVIEISVASGNEGTFTPTVLDSNSGATYNAGLALGEYYKIGKIVFFTILVNTINTTGTPSGNLRIGNLPFTNSIVNNTPISVGNTTNFGNNFFSVYPRIPSGANYIDFNYQNILDNNTNTSFFAVTLTNAGIELSGSYITND